MEWGRAGWGDFDVVGYIMSDVKTVSTVPTSVVEISSCVWLQSLWEHVMSII